MWLPLAWPPGSFCITHIGIDEISRQKGHVYLTNVYDLKTGTLIWSGEGRTKDTLSAFFDILRLQSGPAKLVGICCDMWPSFIETVKAKAPQATLVFDKFHIVRQLTEAVDTVSRQEVNEKGKEHKKLSCRHQIHLAQEPLESHGQTEGFSQLPGDTEPEDPPGLSAQGVVPGLLAVSDKRGGSKVPGPVVLVGDGIKDQADAGICSTCSNGMRRTSSPTSICRSQTEPLKGSTTRPRSSATGPTDSDRQRTTF